MKFRMLTVLLALFLFVALSFSQTIPVAIGNALISNDATVPPVAPLTVRKQVEEVNLVLSITDRKGHFVQGLGQSDLTILDNNQKQSAITFFQRQTDLPLHIALVFDVSSSVANRFDAEQFTIRSFLKQVSRPGDSVMLYAFNQGIAFETPVGNNWKQISRRIKKLKPGGETALYDAATQAAHALGEDRRPARKIMILISDGEENASKSSLDSTLGSVLKAETVVYTVNVGQDRATEIGREGETTLKKLADATGGIYLHADENGEVGSAFAKIRRELRSQYALAYRPSNIGEKMFHQLTVLAGNLRVRCRKGYYVRASN